MKILIISLAYHPFVGGAEIAIAEITKRLPQHQWQLLTVNLDGQQLSREQVGNVKVERFGRGRWGKVIFPLWATWRGWQLIRRGEVELVWPMMANQAGMAAMFLSYLAPRVPYLLTLQEGDAEATIERKTQLIKPLYRRIYQRATHIQAISSYLAARARHYGYRDEVRIIPNGVDTEHFSFQPTAKGSAPEKVLVTSSRLVEKNGVDVVIRALPLLPADVVFHIAGVGPKENNLRTLAQELEVADRVVFHGLVEQRDMPEFLRCGDVFVRAARSEGLGIAYLEAMAMGLPTIGTPVGGIVDFLVDHETGWYCQPDRPETVAAAVAYVLDPEHADEVARVTAAASQCIVSRYQWDSIAIAMQQLMATLIVEQSQCRLVLATGLYPPDIGGPATYSKLLHDQLPVRGIAVDVVSFGRVRHLPKGIRHLRYVMDLIQRLYRSDIVYAQDTVSVGVPAAVAALLLRKRLAVRVPGDYAWEQSRQRCGVRDGIDEFQNIRYGWRVELLRYLQRWTVNRAAVVVTPSHYFQRLVQGWVHQPSKVHVIYNGIDLAELDRMRESVSPASTPTLVTVGRLVPWKGMAELLPVLAELPDWRLVIIGDGPERQRLEALIAKQQLEHRVELTGALSRQQMAERLAAATVFVLNTSFESFSFQIVEAMRLRVPIVTTNIGNIPEIITSGEEGILVAPGDVVALVGAIEQLASDSALRQRLVEAAYQKSSQFSVAVTIEKTASLIERL